MNVLTKFHEDRTVNVASREKCPAPRKPYQSSDHEDWTINVASRVLSRKNAPPLFHDDLKINVTSRVLTRKNAPPPGGHVFQPTGIIFELVQDIIGMNLLTKFHEDQTINVASTWFKQKSLTLIQALFKDFSRPNFHFQGRKPYVSFP
ncbi:hypothetical protein DPMN_116278 [Dreissena polymorpha]|uniref:Uncharacterized protein n=1 Tax=Dreissena polymorpha TaxID=45954 RepID=A0A9D4QTE7_DREPO|nr:hypothetical protein DPMN_116278 [Dreissena polymorpha]